MGKKTEVIEGKRQVPQVLRSLLQLDVLLTDNFCRIVERIVPRRWNTHYKALEISCHGIPWLVGWLAFIWLWYSPSLFQMQVNFYIGLLLDAAVVAVVKAITRRRRPRANQGDMFATTSLDKFSFPSGHATRACFISYFFIRLYSVSSLFEYPLLLWSAAVCVSRILLRRHHILDVTAGAFIGVLEGVVLGRIWLNQEWCAWLISSITDEKLDGGEYHV